MPLPEEDQQQQQTAGDDGVVDDDAAFAAGFAEARGEEPPADEVKPEGQEEQQVEGEDPALQANADDKKAEGEQQEKTDPEPEQPAQPVATAPKLTDEELNRILAVVPDLQAQNRKAFGKIGELQQVINELKGKDSGGQASLRVNADQLKRLNKDYPELAQALAEDLSELPAGPDGKLDPASFEPIVEQRVSAARTQLMEELETKLLTMQHRDWPQIIAAPEFALWKQTQTADEQAKLDSSWDAMYLSDKFTEYKTWLKSRSTQPDDTTQKRQHRLQQAVVPEGKPPVNTGLSDDDAFAAGFNAVRTG